jgi:2-polyprenyl-6-methoxyphenol hydroxylase-like FAD-dependent oxidoreductase
MSARAARRHAEIAGAGFAGLAAATALAQHGWSVRVHERADRLRTTGAGIYLYENGLRVLEALGAYTDAVRDAPLAHTRETRDQDDRVLAVHRWGDTSRVFSILRQQVIDALAAAARRAGVEIITNSQAVAATAEGVLVLADGRRLEADLVIAADGANSRLRDGLHLLSKRRFLPDGAIRLLIGKSADELRSAEGGKTIEYWSGSRRILYTPCSPTQIYVAMTMLDRDAEAKTVPIKQELWKASFPHLGDLIERLGSEGRYDRFEVVKLKRWSSGKVAVIGDAAHALPPNIGQGAGCAMMNALALAVYLDRASDVTSGLEAWERNERPLTEHTQRISVFLGLPTTWPPYLRRTFFTLAGRSKWLIRQRTRTALHKPTGTSET